jgi:hypothetical protein
MRRAAAGAVRAIVVAVLLCAPAGQAGAAEGEGGALDRTPLPGWFPVGDLFEAVVADPKQEHSYVSVHSFDVEGLGQYTVGAVGYGADFGIYRWPAKAAPEGWQVSIKGGVFSIFNLGAPSLDLINTDYTIGLALTHRRGPFSGRFKYYHQSTHLGDEFLLSGDYPYGERINYSYEAFDLLVAYDGDYRNAKLRGYMGGAYRTNREPREMKPGSVQGGAEFYRKDTICAAATDLCLGRFVAGADVQSMEEQNWHVSVSGKAGVEWGRPGSGNRRIRAMLEAYDGHVPFGQFYNVNLQSIGFAVYLYY